jgi:hypothetical protein
VARVPEAVALEQHPDPLAALRHTVEPSVELEVLERGQLTVDERLVGDVADLASTGLDLELAARRREQAGDEGEERRLPRPVRARHDQEAAALDVDVEAADDALVAEAPLEPPRPDHEARTSTRTNAKKTTEMTPFMVKKAVSRRRRSFGETSACS